MDSRVGHCSSRSCGRSEIDSPDCIRIHLPDQPRYAVASGFGRDSHVHWSTALLFRFCSGVRQGVAPQVHPFCKPLSSHLVVWFSSQLTPGSFACCPSPCDTNACLPPSIAAIVARCSALISPPDFPQPLSVPLDSRLKCSCHPVCRVAPPKYPLGYPSCPKRSCCRAPAD